MKSSSASGSTIPMTRLTTVLKTGLRIVQFLGRGRGARIAARLFCSPFPSKLATRHFRAPEGVRIETMAFERASLTLYHWPAPAGAPQLLMTHGWGGWGLQLTALANSLSAAGWAVVVIDQPAHGRSAAWNTTLPQFVRALAYVSARLGRVEALLGHSMGATAACIAAAGGMDLRKLVLIAAPISMTQITREYAAAFGMPERLRADMVRHLEAREGMVFERMDATYTAPRISAQTLVVHDCDDTTVPYASGQKLLQNLQNAKLVSTQGLGHRRLLKDPTVVESVTQFLGAVREA